MRTDLLDRREVIARTPALLRMSRGISLSVLVALSLNWCGAPSAHCQEPVPTIKVRVLNYTRVTPTTVAAAERAAGQLLRDAGLNVIWIDCRVGEPPDSRSAPCEQSLSPTEVLLRVLQDRSRNGIPENAFGFAVPPVMANVYYEHTARLARTEGYEVTSVFAGVIAHEIGHLMLGTSSHSEMGLMQSHWGRIQLQLIRCGGLHFTPQQSKLIKAEGQRRMKMEMPRIIVASSINQGPATD